jgi:hypothetical protein
MTPAPYLNFLPRISWGDPSAAVSTLAGLTSRYDGKGESRFFTKIFNQELHANLMEQAKRGNALQLLKGHVIAYGLTPDHAQRAMERLLADSMTFRNSAQGFVRKGGTAALLVGRGGGNSRSTLGLDNENVYINRDQGNLSDLVCHEFGHAFGGHLDGPQGGIGPNQVFQAQVKYEMGGRYIVKPYGTEVGPEQASYRAPWEQAAERSVLVRES